MVRHTQWGGVVKYFVMAMPSCVSRQSTAMLPILTKTLPASGVNFPRKYAAHASVRLYLQYNGIASESHDVHSD